MSDAFDMTICVISFFFTNNAYVLEQKANDFYPRNDTYLPLVGDVIVVK